MTAPSPRPGSFRTLGRQTAIYSFGVMLGRAVSFLMLPVYTRYLTPSDYGLVQLLELLVEVVAIFFTAGATAGLQRFYFKASSADDRKSLVSTTFLSVLALALACTVLLLTVSPLVWRYALKSAGEPWFIRLAAINFMLSFLTTFPMSFAQTTQRPGIFLSASLVKLVLQLSLNITFIVGMHLGVAGLLWSTFTTNLLIGTVMTVWLLRQTGLKFDRGMLRELRRFGTPYQVSWGGAFLLTFGDRFFLQAARGTSAVGLYALAYQFGFLLVQLGSTPFLSAWNPHRHELAKLPKAERDSHYAMRIPVLQRPADHDGHGACGVHPPRHTHHDDRGVSQRGGHRANHPAGLHHGGVGGVVQVRHRHFRTHGARDEGNMVDGDPRLAAVCDPHPIVRAHGSGGGNGLWFVPSGGTALSVGTT